MCCHRADKVDRTSDVLYPGAYYGLNIGVSEDGRECIQRP